MAFQWTLGLEGLKRRILHDNGNYGRVNILTVITKIFKKFVPKQIIYEIGESMREIQDRSCREYERNPRQILQRVREKSMTDPHLSHYLYGDLISHIICVVIIISHIIYMVIIISHI